MNYKIAAIPGDGIGPEVTMQALRVLHAVGDVYGHIFDVETYLAGGAAIDETGECLPESTVAGCKAADAVLLGAVGGDKWDSQPRENRPETALLGLRKALGCMPTSAPPSCSTNWRTLAR
jgi:3-isopropylmalate dehydrogenase